jgi:hypothetical protein
MRHTRSPFIVLVLVAALALALALGACGGSGGDDDDVPSAGGSTTTTAAGATGGGTADALAFTDCMRDHGVEMEDPDPATGIPQFSGGAAATETPEFESAMEACQDLLPEGGIRGETGEDNLDELQAFAECMRENGMPDFPDPQPGENGVFGSDETIDRNSPAFQAASEACQDTLSGIGGEDSP